MSSGHQVFASILYIFYLSTYVYRLTFQKSLIFDISVYLYLRMCVSVSQIANINKLNNISVIYNINLQHDCEAYLLSFTTIEYFQSADIEKEKREEKKNAFIKVYGARE